MNKILKWLGIIAGGLAAVIILLLLIIPMLFDIQKYKPMIEARIARATGRPFTIGGDLKLSLFPLAGIAFTDLHLGNPDGFAEKDFVSIKSFDVKVKLLPLLSKDIQVKRCVIIGPRITLERTKDGRNNWTGLLKKETTDTSEKKNEKAGEAPQSSVTALPIKGLTAGEFSISDGELIWIDHTSETRKEIKDLKIAVRDVSLDRPVKLSASADADGRPVTVEGDLGPVGKEPGKGPVTVNLAIKAMNLLFVKLKGTVTDIAAQPQFDLDLSVDAFSPRDLMKGLNKALSIRTSDPDALKSMSAGMKIKGTPDNIEIPDGAIKLDQSSITFSCTARDLAKPDLTFKINLDKMDADRYLPPVDKTQGVTVAKQKGTTDYGPLRKMELDGAININELHVKGVQLKNIQVRLKGKNGTFNADPISLNAYEGNIKTAAGLDVRGDVPVTQAKIEVQGLQVKKMISDFMKKEILEGTASASVNISMSGDNAALIKKSLNGSGEIRLKDGAIVGVDLPGMIQNIKAKFGLAQPGEKKDRTDFSEFIVPFNINDGVVNTRNTSLVSPMLRVLAKGNADLAKETLDFRIEPTFVKTLTGQGDTSERSGITVPVLVKGTFTDPKFSPDLSGILKKSIEKGINKLLGGENKGEDGKTQPAKDSIKGLLKGLMGK